jgi:hypothetical protein
MTVEQRPQDRTNHRHVNIFRGVGGGESAPEVHLTSMYLYHIHTTWIWSLVTHSVAGGPEAGGFARVSPKPWCAFGQYTHYDLLSSKTHHSFKSDLYSTQYLVIFSEFCLSRF